MAARRGFTARRANDYGACRFRSLELVHAIAGTNAEWQMCII